MNHPCIIPIVEGHGEVEAIRILLSRIWTELLGEEYIHVLTPLRIPQGKILNKPDELSRYIRLAYLKLKDVPLHKNQGVLLLFDADSGLPCVLAKKITESIQDHHDEILLSCVIANKEFETWFVASSDQMPEEFSTADTQTAASAEPENRGKAWVEQNALRSYSETADMPRLSKKINLSLVRDRCPSFDKLCREMEKLKSHSIESNP